MRIHEEGSSLLFGDFNKDDCFHIEKSDIYQKSLSSHGIKTVEFVLYRPDGASGNAKLWLVEGKKSFAKVHQAARFGSDIEAIAQKFMDSLQLTCSIWLGSHSKKAKLPCNMEMFFKQGGLFRFVLVIKKHERELLPAIEEAIKSKLKKELRLWRFEVKVLDEELAIKKNLAIREETQ